MNPNNTEIDLTMPYIIASVVLSLYREIFSITWTPIRYQNFLLSVTTSITAAQNRNPFIVFHSVKLIKKYMESMKEQNLALEPEYCIFIAAFRIGQKFNDDFYCNQFEIDSSVLTNMSSFQLKQFEFKLLDKINYQISMTLHDYLAWKKSCQEIYVTEIIPNAIDDIVNSYHGSDSFMDILHSNMDPYCLYHGINSMPSPPSSVISKNDFNCSETSLLFNSNMEFYN